MTGDVLEIGAGTGLNVAHYDRASRVDLLEPSPHMREQLRRRAAEAPIETNVVAGSAEDLPFPDASFDAVVATLVFCTIEDPSKAITEIHRVLKPGATLAFIEHVRANGARGALQDLFSTPHAKLGGGCRPKRQTGELLEQAGFDLETSSFTLKGNLDPLTRTGLFGTATKR